MKSLFIDIKPNKLRNAIICEQSCQIALQAKILALPSILVMKCLLNPRNVLVTDLVRNVREMGSSTYEVVFIMKRFGGTRDIRFILNVVEKEKGRRLVYLFEGAEKL